MLRQVGPGRPQLVDFERGEIDIAGAQITDGDPVVNGGCLDRHVEVGEIVGPDGADEKQQGETGGACEADDHGYSPDFEDMVQ